MIHEISLRKLPAHLILDDIVEAPSKLLDSNCSTVEDLQLKGEFRHHAFVCFKFSWFFAFFKKKKKVLTNSMQFPRSVESNW